MVVKEFYMYDADKGDEVLHKMKCYNKQEIIDIVGDNEAGYIIDLYTPHAYMYDADLLEDDTLYFILDDNGIKVITLYLDEDEDEMEDM